MGKDTAANGIYTIRFVSSVRCVEERGQGASAEGATAQTQRDDEGINRYGIDTSKGTCRRGDSSNATGRRKHKQTRMCDVQGQVKKGGLRNLNRTEQKHKRAKM